MALFEQSPSRSGSRFGALSSNMFFTRNTAKPKRVRHIEGLNGALICNVNDDPSVIRQKSNSTLGLIRVNAPMFETPRRAEKFIPPMGFWNTYGVVHDTERWRKELATLATASGLGVEKDEHKNHNRQMTTADQQNASRSGAHYSTRTGRFNEGAAKSRGRTGSKHATAYSDMLFNVPEHEREMWMLQVLCQLLGTSDLEDVQSWLVSASQPEKEQASAMINSALRGLKESERTSDQVQQPVDLDSLSNFVEKQKSEEKQATQKYIRESFRRPLSTLQSINEEQSVNNHLGDSWTNLLNNNNNSDPSSQHLTTYKRNFQNYNRRAYSSFDTLPSNIKNDDSLNESNEILPENENNEQVEIIQPDDDQQQHQRSRSVSLTKMRKQSKNQQKTLGRATSSQRQKNRVESLQFNDDDNNDMDNDYVDNKKNITEQRAEEEEEQPQRRGSILPPIKVKNLSKNQDDDVKGRKIRELKTRLSRQEEEAKKQINELHTKQSRLENALKLLTQQSSRGKRRQQNSENIENYDASVSNPNHESLKENDCRLYDKQAEMCSSDKQRLSNTNKSREDTRQSGSYSGVWKPDASTLHRLQGN